MVIFVFVEYTYPVGGYVDEKRHHVISVMQLFINEKARANQEHAHYVLQTWLRVYFQ